ncbi:hypothetical protein SLNSH_02435 [Alsobacter soli]|uniref:Lipoprotein n=1 Tax=Alsobacter soli TaxID=2109933 RepID=A0A2T1HYM0_9HYPH|nr:hypothetical protein [Alsobacter soli]PSC06678.1 hypothetical protein SLNSH_02435 [Alsobacter soli]
MKSFIVLGAAAVLVSACAAPPIVSEPLIALNGEFRGPVVADRGVPISARYEGYCEHRPRRWDHGWYRAYTPAPCVTVVRHATVRALY